MAGVKKQKPYFRLLPTERAGARRRQRHSESTVLPKNKHWGGLCYPRDSNQGWRRVLRDDASPWWRGTTQ